jgi:hypothetical protein
MPAELTDVALEEQLFTAVDKKQSHRQLAEPDWAAIHCELKRKHVALQILWDEHIERRPSGYRLVPLLRVVPRVGIVAVGRDAAEPYRRRQAVYRVCGRYGACDRRSAQRQDQADADLCRGAGRFQLHLCRSELDRWTQALADWIGAHIQALEAIASVPQLLVPDTAKVAVIKACRYELISAVQPSGSRSTMHDALRRRY